MSAQGARMRCDPHMNSKLAAISCAGVTPISVTDFPRCRKRSSCSQAMGAIRIGAEVATARCTFFTAPRLPLSLSGNKSGPWNRDLLSERSRAVAGLQPMSNPMADASAEPSANDTADAIAELVAFLRRFGSMLSGQNADKLRDAADLIEDLLEALDRERKEFRDVEARLTQHIRAHASAQVEIGSAKAELSVLQAEIAEQKRKASVAHDAVFGEAQAQAARADKAERELRNISDELVQLRTKLSKIGQSYAVLPVATLDALRTQFEFLGRQFGKAGDATSQAMCEIGACKISDAVADSLKETAAAGRAVAERAEDAQ
jgi:hypothetical protein